MAKKKTIKKTPVILRNALSVYERSITRFSDVVCQFTVQNGNQISYDILEVSANPDPTPRVERSITRFKEVVCEFVVIDGTDVHAYELEPVYADITGGGTTYTITNNLTNVTNSNAAASVGDGDPYTATLTADAGYTLDSVTVTMGGVDVTSSVYNAGSINIAAVSGNIVITASASVSGPKYIEVGTPTIENNILTVSDGNFIKTPEVFSPGANTWKIICKCKRISESGTIYMDLFGSVKADNTSAYSLLFEYTASNFAQGSMFISSNGTSWNVTSSHSIGMPNDIAWLWISIEYDGTNYIAKYSTDGVTYTNGYSTASASLVKEGFAVGFGMKRNGYYHGDIDLSECKIYIDNQLWWSAI